MFFRVLSDNAGKLKIQNKLKFEFLCFLTVVGPGIERWAGLRRTGLWGCLDGSCKRWKSCRSIRSDCPEKTSRNSCRWTTSTLASKNKLWRYKQPCCLIAIAYTVLFPTNIVWKIIEKRIIGRYCYWEKLRWQRMWWILGKQWRSWI